MLGKEYNGSIIGRLRRRTNERIFRPPQNTEAPQNSEAVVVAKEGFCNLTTSMNCASLHAPLGIILNRANLLKYTRGLHIYTNLNMRLKFSN